ncbi:MAG: DegT/DnrJ/EryC1/StrS family aminotransferase [Desulfofustis sp.]
MNVPLLDLGPPLAEQKQEIIDKVAEVVASTRYIGGPEVEGLETELAAYCEVEGAVGVSSGTDALLVTLMALDVGQGDLVLTTPFSFFATMGVILRLGAEPIFVDIDPVSYNMDAALLEETLAQIDSDRIKAIMPVHLYGQCADMSRIMAVAEAYDIPVIEDAAQAIGAQFPHTVEADTAWRKAGAVGRAGCFSFFPSKNLGAVGDGGMVVSSDVELIRKIQLLRNHGGEPKYYHSMVGGNFRLDPIQAAVLRIKFKHLERWHQQRRENAERYNFLIGEQQDRFDLPITRPTAVYIDQAERSAAACNYHIYNQYVIRVERRDELRDWLKARQVATEVYYPVGLHQQKCFTDHFPSPSLQHAEQAARETLALPIYPGLTPDMQEYVVKCLAEFYR